MNDFVQPTAASIDFQWTGCAHSGCADLAYLLACGVERGALASHFDTLKSVYLSALQDAVNSKADSDRVGSAPAAAVYSLVEFELDYSLEFLDLFTTLLPQLFGDINPAVAASNRDRFGYLTCESEPRIMAWMCEQAALAFDVVSNAGIA